MPFTRGLNKEATRAKDKKKSYSRITMTNGQTGVMRNPFAFGRRMAQMRWNRVERGCAAAAEVAVIYPLYLLGMLYVLGRHDRAGLIHVEFVRDQVGLFALVSLGALLSI
jgi:hypothetical protein